VRSDHLIGRPVAMVAPLYYIEKSVKEVTMRARDLGLNVANHIEWSEN